MVLNSPAQHGPPRSRLRQAAPRTAGQAVGSASGSTAAITILIRQQTHPAPAPFWRGPPLSTPTAGKAEEDRAVARPNAGRPRPRTLAPPAVALHRYPHALGRAQLSVQGGSGSISTAARRGGALSLARRDVAWPGGLCCCHGVGSVAPGGRAGRARPGRGLGDGFSPALLTAWDLPAETPASGKQRCWAPSVPGLGPLLGLGLPSTSHCSQFFHVRCRNLCNMSWIKVNHCWQRPL